MRSLTKYPLFTKNGEPLDGYIRVLLRDGSSQLASLTDINGNALANPYPIANGLPESQVFVDDIDVDVKVLDSDSVQVMSYADLSNATIEGVTTTSIVGIETVEELRVAVAETGSTVVLLGYNAVGDKPALIYTLVDDNSLSDDGGLTLASGVVGKYWVSKVAGVVDVRHYNIFPNNTASLPNIAKIKWFFPYLGGSAYIYNIGGATIHGATCENNVVLNGDSETLAWVYDTDVGGVTGYVKVVADTIKTSIVRDDDVELQPRSKLIIDSNLYPLRVTDCDVAVYSNFTQTISLTRCNIRYNGGVISSATQRLYQCDVDGRALTLASNYTYDHNRTNANTWSDGDDFVSFCVLNDIPRCDCGGLTVSSVVDNNADIEIINAVLDDLQCVQTGATITFNKCSGTIANILCDEDENYTGKAVFRDCNIANSNWGTKCKAIDAENTTFDVSMQFCGGSHFSNCTFNRAGVYVKVENSTMSQSDVAFVNCRFYQAPPIFSNVIEFGSSEAGIATVMVDNVVMVGNYINGTTPITITDTSIYKDTLGTYQVENNGGGLLESKIPDAYFNKVMYDDTDTENFTYDASKHMRLTSKAFSIASMTFNFGETYNENTYLSRPLFSRCFATFCKRDGDTGTYDESLRYGVNYSHDGYGTTYGAIEAIGMIINPTDIKSSSVSNIKYQFCPQLTVTSCSQAGHTIISYDGGYATGHPRFWMTVTSYGAYDAEIDWAITPT